MINLHITANVMLLMVGTLFTLTGVNLQSRIFGLFILATGALELSMNTGIIQ